MEPVKGGSLANPQKEILDLMKKADPDASPASWAIRFAASLDGILTVLSGMSDIDQMKDNLSYMKDFAPLDENEREVIRHISQILGRSAGIPCTACSYCTKGCPQQIPIPEVFKARNLQLNDGRITEAKEAYAAISAKGNNASACIGCGQCEAVCPQHIEIIAKLKECAEALQ